MPSTVTRLAPVAIGVILAVSAFPNRLIIADDSVKPPAGRIPTRGSRGSDSYRRPWIYRFAHSFARWAICSPKVNAPRREEG